MVKTDAKKPFIFPAILCFLTVFSVLWRPSRPTGSFCNTSVRSEKSISLSLCLQIFFLNLLLYLSFQTLHSFMLATFFLPLSCIYLAFLVFQLGYATSHLAHIIVLFFFVSPFNSFIYICFEICKHPICYLSNFCDSLNFHCLNFP